MRVRSNRGGPRSKGEKEHDVVIGEGGVWDAPDFRLGSYGGEGRDHHGGHPIFQSDDHRHQRQRRVTSKISRQAFALHAFSGIFVTL